MDLEELPTELILKIFSYVPQQSLLALSQVSERFKQIAFDPFLWTKVMIDSTLSNSPEILSEILNSATLMRQLEATGDDVNLEALASASVRFERLEELTIMGRMLSHPAMRILFSHCRSLATIVLCGEDKLLRKDVSVLQTLSGLKSLILSLYLGVSDITLQQICASCPGLEILKLGSSYIVHDSTWKLLAQLRHLTSLSVTTLSTNGLLLVSVSCRNLESLEIYVMWNANRVPAARAIEGLRKLRHLKVRYYCGNGWFHPDFITPASLEYFDVPELSMLTGQVQILVDNCRELRRVTFDAYTLEGSALVALSTCKNLESICLTGLRGGNLMLEMLWKFPKVAYANLDIMTGASAVFSQFESVLDAVNTNQTSRTRLVIRIFRLPPDPYDALERELNKFKTFLAVKTRQSMKHALVMEERRVRPPDVLLEVETSIATASKTLKCLVLNLRQ